MDFSLMPPPEPGHVWAIRMWPDGRKILEQALLQEMHYADEAARLLQNEKWANVWLDDAAMVIALLPRDHPLVEAL